MSQKSRDNSIGGGGEGKEGRDDIKREREMVWEKVGEERVGLEGAK